MLVEVLQLLAREKVFSKAELARRLEVSEEMIEQMLEELVQKGYLKTASISCEQSCSTCPMHDVCAVKGGDRLWVLTAKGLKIGLATEL